MGSKRAARHPVTLCDRRAVARGQRIEQLAAMVETDPEFAEIRTVSIDVNAVAGEAVQ